MGNWFTYSTPLSFNSPVLPKRSSPPKTTVKKQKRGFLSHYNVEHEKATGYSPDSPDSYGSMNRPLLSSYQRTKKRGKNAISKTRQFFSSPSYRRKFLSNMEFAHFIRNH